jgi:hypothetical protein
MGVRVTLDANETAKAGGCAYSGHGCIHRLVFVPVYDCVHVIACHNAATSQEFEKFV